MRRYSRWFTILALSGVFVLSPFSGGAEAKEAFKQESPSNPDIKVSVTVDGQTQEFKSIDEGWKNLSGKSNPVMKLYADWETGNGIEIGGDRRGVTIDLNGHTYKRKSKGSGITIKGGSLTMKNGTIRGCTTKDDGGAILIDKSGSANLSGVTFDKNSAGDNGGAIYVKKGTLTAKNCTFTNNRADDNGGAIAVNSEDTKLFDVVMQNNFADDDGGGLWVNANKVYISGGLIKNNMADYGGGVYVDSAYDINIQGKLIIQDNKTTSNQKSNLCLQDGLLTSARIYSGGLLHGSMVGINKTKSLSSSGYKAVVNTSQYQELTCYSADRGKLVMQKGKMEKVIYMASAFGDMNMAPFIIIFLELVGAAVIITMAVRRKKAFLNNTQGEGESE